MDTTLSDSEKLVQSQIRDLLSREVKPDLVASMEATGQFPHALWRTLSESGWLELGMRSAQDEETLTSWVLGLEQFGWHATPGPVAEHFATVAYLSETGADPGLLSQASSGQSLVSAAIQDKPGTTTSATRISGSDVSLRGTKILIPFARSCDAVIVEAEMDGSHVFVATNLRSPGISISDIKSVSRNQQCVLTFEGAEGHLLGSSSTDSRSDFKSLYLLALDAYAVGLMGRILEISTQYVASRVQFGRPIGSFQAVQHHCADMAVAYLGAQTSLYYAAWLMDQRRDSKRAESCCHAVARDAAGVVVGNAHQVHGAMGFTMEYPLHIFSRRAKVFQHSYGNASDHREDLARLERPNDPYWRQLVGSGSKVTSH